MDTLYDTGLFIFRRDLRLNDNTSLISAMKSCKSVACCFIFNPDQIEKNSYRSDNALQFMIDSLLSLKQEIEKLEGKLYFFHGKNLDVLSKLRKEINFDAVFFNKDYTLFSKRRDAEIKKYCTKNNIEFISFDDALLHPPGKILKKDGFPYTVYTPFYRASIKENVSETIKFNSKNFYKSKVTIELSDKKLECFLQKRNESIFVKGGRSEALKIIKNISKFNSYKNVRDFPNENGTTCLSAHLKFGTISCRELYHKIKNELGIGHTLISQLYWRDFYYNIAHYFPHVFSGCFKKKYDVIRWENNKEKFKKWCEGKTGFPIVDAGMRELNKTGYMHNRVRMITASFLIKDLHIDWRWGEKYFATKLVDYDPCLNNGNWQWSASTGCDAQPYFRIFNPWLQQKKFDSECKYIKKWIPEIKELSNKEIHDENRTSDTSYPSPMIEHALEKDKTLAMFKMI